jgi:ABC-type Mn2+/Zn2+ transport system permease subunit
MESLIVLLPSISTELLRSAAVAGAVGIAAAVLSVFVVLRKWAYLGDGISHAGFGGVGTAVLISLAFPSLNDGTPIYLIASVFALATAGGIAWASRKKGVSGDVAIGIFVAAALAWGFVAFSIHDHLARAGSAAGNGNGWEDYLLGDLGHISTITMLLGIVLSAGVVIIIAALHRQITLYCFDPVLAEVTGVPVAFVHYLLIMLVGLVIVIGMRLIGNLLIPAMLVLPGAIGLALCRRLRAVILSAVGASLIATFIGFSATRHWPFLRPGPAITMALFLEFLVARGYRSMRGGDT